MRPTFLGASPLGRWAQSREAPASMSYNGRHLRSVLAAGIEPATPCLQSRCSSNLSYASKCPMGVSGPPGSTFAVRYIVHAAARTHSLLLASVRWTTTPQPAHPSEPTLYTRACWLVSFIAARPSSPATG